MDLPNRLESWDEILGRWWAPQREDMPQKFHPLAPYNSGNRKSWPRTLWTRVHPKINELKAKSGVWEVKIIHQEAQGTHPWSPQRNLERNALESMNRATNENTTKRLRKSPKTEIVGATRTLEESHQTCYTDHERFIQGLACLLNIHPSRKISAWSSQSSPMENLRKIGRENSKSKWARVSRDGCHPLFSKYVWRQPKDETTPIT
jgi:hypothetical protein